MFWWLIGLPAFGILTFIFWAAHKLSWMSVDSAIDEAIQHEQQQALNEKLAFFQPMRAVDPARTLGATPLHLARQDAQFHLREGRLDQAESLLRAAGMSDQGIDSFAKAYMQDREREGFADALTERPARTKMFGLKTA